MNNAVLKYHKGVRACSKRIKELYDLVSDTDKERVCILCGTNKKNHCSCLCGSSLRVKESSNESD